MSDSLHLLFSDPALAFSDPTLPWAIAVIALAGVVRGASGFGQALVFVPLAGLFYAPRFAVPLLWLADAMVTPLLLRPHWRQAEWGEVLPLVVGGALLLPVGIVVLTRLDPTLLRWIICITVLASTAAIAVGWRFEVRETRLWAVVVGGLAGFFGGATGMSGPPLVLFWLGRSAHAARIRSNIFLYLWLTGLISLAIAAIRGLLPVHLLADGVVLAPCYAVATLLGNVAFHQAGTHFAAHREMLFRRLALGLCAAAATVGLPIWM